MNKRRKQLLKFLLDNDKDTRGRLIVVGEILGRFPDYNNPETNDYDFYIVEHIEKSLERVGEVPTQEYYQKNYDFNVNLENINTPENASEAIDIVENEYRQSMKKSLLNTMSQHVEGGEDKDDAEDLIHDVSDTVHRYDSRISRRRLKEAKELYEIRKTKERGLTTGIEDIERVVEELELGTMSTLAGAEGHFKTTVSISMMYDNIVDGRNMIFVSYEMGRESILYSLVARHSYSKKFMEDHDPVPFQKINKGNLTEEEEGYLWNVVWKDLKENEAYGEFEVLEYNDFDGFTESQLRSRLNKQGFRPHGVFVDYIQMMEYESVPNRDYRGNNINYFIRQWIAIANDVDRMGSPCHVQLLSQTNRKGQKEARKADGKYENDALLKANLLNQASSYIMFTYGPDELAEVGLTKLYVSKVRNNEPMVDPVEVRIDPQYNSVGGRKRTGDVGLDDVAVNNEIGF